MFIILLISTWLMGTEIEWSENL
uniref:Uncharacterized protein n=1 Tax=Rhizophora mucronata TaxID=61149 RepID=A0A2P2PVG3_RHIMU